MTMTLQTYASVSEASAALKADGARYLGGGTLLVRRANEGDVSFSTFVRATAPSLSAISVSGSSVTLGASVTMASIARHPALEFLASAARAVGGPAVRNMATVGGNLFAPTPYGDFATALLALGANVSVDGVEVPVEAFLAERERVHADSIVTAVRFDIPAGNGFRFLKASRVKPTGASVVTIAAVLQEQDGVIASARVAIGCMADRPVRAEAAERALIGRKRDEDGIARAMEVVSQGTAPVTDAIASAWYRREVLPVHFGRMLLG